MIQRFKLGDSNPRYQVRNRVSSYEAAAGLVSCVSADIFLCKAEHILGNLRRLSAGDGTAGAGWRGDTEQRCHDCE